MENVVELATPGIKVEEEMAELDLAEVKRVTQQVRSFGFENLEDPIFHWRLGTNEISKSEPISSDLFPINSDFIGQLKLTNTKLKNQFKVSLHLFDLETGETRNTLNPFRFFLCKFKQYSGQKKSVYFSLNTLSVNEEGTPLDFKFYIYHSDTIGVELFQEPRAMMEYRSPYNNTVVGKIEKYDEMNSKTNYYDFVAASPRFNFGSPNQLMIVRFCYLEPQYASVLFAVLHILSPTEALGPPFSFTATFTIFSQKEKVKDLVHKVFFRRDETKNEYRIRVAFTYELDRYFVDDTLFYKVVIEPHPSK